MAVQTANTSSELPQEIIEAVLVRAPVKTVLKFRCVSELWRCLLGTKRFITDHLRQSQAAPGFIFNLSIQGLMQCDVDSPFCEQVVESKLNYVDIDRVLGSGYKSVRCVLGCVDGLVCHFDGLGGFSFWNPSTRVTTLIPRIGAALLTPGFGFDESTGEFKVFVVDTVPNQMNFKVVSSLTGNSDLFYVRKVYSSKSNSWKVLGNGPLSYTAQSGVLVCGKLHWMRAVGERRDIVSFDIKSEVFGEIELPFSFLGRRLGVFGGCLSWLYGNSGSEVEVWVMEEYGVKESWTRVINLQPPFPAPYYTCQMGQIVFAYASCFLVYYPNSNVFHFLAHDQCFRGVYHCVESLVSPDYACRQDATLQIDIDRASKAVARRVLLVWRCFLILNYIYL